jgi:hypothetical protein
MKKQHLLSSSPSLSVTTSDYRHCCCFCCWLFSQPSYCTSTPSSSLFNIITPSLKLIKKDPSHLKRSLPHKKKKKKKTKEEDEVLLCSGTPILVFVGGCGRKGNPAMTALLCTEKKIKNKKR